MGLLMSFSPMLLECYEACSKTLWVKSVQWVWISCEWLTRGSICLRLNRLMADAKHQCVSICCEIELSILDRILFLFFIFIVYIFLFLLTLRFLNVRCQSSNINSLRYRVSLYSNSTIAIHLCYSVRPLIFCLCFLESSIFKNDFFVSYGMT